MKRKIDYLFFCFERCQFLSFLNQLFIENYIGSYTHSRSSIHILLVLHIRIGKPSFLQLTDRRRRQVTTEDRGQFGQADGFGQEFTDAGVGGW